MLNKFKSDLPKDWQVQILSTIESIENNRHIWESLHSNESYPIINADIDRYLSVLKTMDESHEPFVLLLKQNQQTKVIVAGRKECMSMPIRLGYKTFFNVRFKSLTVVYGGIIGNQDSNITRLLINQFRRLLSTKEINVIYFNHLCISSLFYQQIKELPFYSRNHFPVLHIHWRMSIPKNIETFFKTLSKKHRANLRRAIRKFEEEYSEQIELQNICETNHLDKIIRDTESISLKTYQHELNAGFSNNTLIRSILKTDAEKKRLSLSLLYVANRPLAFQWGTIYKDTYFLEKIGYDPQWSQWSIGNILFTKNLENLCAKSQVKFIDFGFGDASYKESYSDESWPEAAATYIYASRLIPLLINLINSINSGLTCGLTWCLKKTYLSERAKRMWRRKLKMAAEKTSSRE